MTSRISIEIESLIGGRIYLENFKKLPFIPESYPCVLLCTTIPETFHHDRYIRLAAGKPINLP